MLDYDILGDIHGQGELLERLLLTLGYERIDGVYKASDVPGARPRMAVFLGDFIDRGPENRRVVEIVRRMVEAGHALAVMGNHELNAIAYHTRHPQTGEPLRPHTEKSSAQHRRFLDEFPLDGEETRDVIGWFRTLPLFLELDSSLGREDRGGLCDPACDDGSSGRRLRLVHACWDQASVDHLRERLGDPPRLDDASLVESTTNGTLAFEALETLLKGPEIPLPGEVALVDKDDHPRRRVRYRWWATARTYRQAAMVAPEQRSAVPDRPLPEGMRRAPYAADAAPVFVGHYWLQGEIRPLRHNVACLDFSVGKGGPMVAYRWRPADQDCREPPLRVSQFVAVRPSSDRLGLPLRSSADA